MLKTPPRVAALGIALTVLAIGTGNVLASHEVAEAPEILIEEFELKLESFGVNYVIPEAPAPFPRLQLAC